MKHLGDITQINGAGSAVWSSEIERNAVAVAKYHFPEGANDD
jgi:hypothetical protein